VYSSAGWLILTVDIQNN